MKLITGLLFLLATNLAFAECDRPIPPQLPDGASADLETMVEGQKAVKAYVAATEAYLDCLNEEGAAAADEETPEEQLARIELHNKAVDDMEALAAAFNEEIREYKAKGE
ncbi:MAG: hypothetical protein QNI86_02360 [Halieaceae bacterium]|nr:hypothetical protein [Halieaceae bacterium]